MSLLSEGERKKLLSDLTEEQAEALLYDWKFWARPNQLPPEGDWYVWLIRSGRGFGKTRIGAETVIEWAKDFSPIALVGQTKADVRDTMVELGESSILKVSSPWFMPVYESSKRRVVWPNGAVGVLYSGDEPDQLRGPQHMKAWVDELAKFKYPKDSWDNLEMGLRLGPSPQAVVTTTPRPIPIIKELIKDPETVDIRASTYENIDNLSERFINRIVRRYEGTRLGRQELEGELLDDNPNALWKRVDIEDSRVGQYPELIRIVVAVDPQGTDDEDSAETGIAVVAKGRDKHFYVLEDATIKGSPHTWGLQSVAAYNNYKADRLVGEANNGGDMVENTIKTVDGGDKVAYKKVHASRGKLTRAEPISSLYEQGKVHHVGTFPQLEDQMCEWVPGEKSPDRMDALVWAITELMDGSGSYSDISLSDNLAYTRVSPNIL